MFADGQRKRRHIVHVGQRNRFGGHVPDQVFQAFAVVKSISRNRIDRRGNADRLQLPASVKCLAVDGFHFVRQNRFFQHRTAVECTGINCFQVLREIHGLKVGTATERTGIYIRHAVRNIDFLQGGASVESAARNISQAF